MNVNVEVISVHQQYTSIVKMSFLFDFKHAVIPGQVSNVQRRHVRNIFANELSFELFYAPNIFLLHVPVLVQISLRILVTNLQRRRAWTRKTLQKWNILHTRAFVHLNVRAIVCLRSQ